MASVWGYNLRLDEPVQELEAELEAEAEPEMEGAHAAVRDADADADLEFEFGLEDALGLEQAAYTAADAGAAPSDAMDG
eukprot:tig00021038_g17492.t1